MIQIDEYIKEIDKLEQKKKAELKNMFHKVSELGEDERKKAICEMYIKCDIKEKDILEAFNIKGKLYLYCDVKIEEKVKCKRCGDYFNYTIESKSTYKEFLKEKDKEIKTYGNKNIDDTTMKNNKFVCSSCKETLKKEIEEREKESNEKWIENREMAKKELERLRTMPYKEYLQTEHWKDVRKKVLRQAKKRCQLCNTKTSVLHIHHRDYSNRGNETMRDVICLCADCHAKFHDKA